MQEVYEAANRPGSRTLETLAPRKTFLMSASGSLQVGATDLCVVKEGETTSLMIQTSNGAMELLNGDQKVDLFWMGDPGFWFRAVKVLGIVVEIVKEIRDDGVEEIEYITIDDSTGVIFVTMPPNFEERKIFSDEEISLGSVVDVLGRLVNSPKGRYIDAYALILKADPHEEIARIVRMQKIYRETYFRGTFERLNAAASITTTAKKKFNAPFRSPLIPSNSSLSGLPSRGGKPFGPIPISRLPHPSAFGLVPSEEGLKSFHTMVERSQEDIRRAGAGKGVLFGSQASQGARNMMPPPPPTLNRSHSSDAFKTPSKATPKQHPGGEIEGLTLHSTGGNSSHATPFALSPFKPEDDDLLQYNRPVDDDPRQELGPDKNGMTEFDGLSAEAMLMVLDEPFDPDEDTRIGKIGTQRAEMDCGEGGADISAGAVEVEEDEFGFDDDGFDMLMLDSLNETENSIKEVEAVIRKHTNGVAMSSLKTELSFVPNIEVILQRVSDVIHLINQY
ncbi:hypothetical protein HDU67_002031 [Dinochytrium kinnereticum]|nr:hypothetical protein HDU67_002031 [Dinochytrium kinnereticum]